MVAKAAAKPNSKHAFLIGRMGIRLRILTQTVMYQRSLEVNGAKRAELGYA